MEFLIALAQRILRLLALSDDGRGWNEEYDLTGLVTHRSQREVGINEIVFRRANLHVVAGGFSAPGPRDGLTQLLLDFPGIGPPVGILEGFS